jgi:hypothetical protein
MSQPSQFSTRWVLALVMGGVVLWGIYVAIGAYRYNPNPWRAVIVLACTGTFLGVWLLLLWARARRGRR